MRRRETTDPLDRYSLAEKKVKRIKGFYSHLAAYVMVNAALITYNIYQLPPEKSVWQFNVFSTALFWGIGVVAHAVSVFGSDWIFGSNWEQRQIRRFMDKEKKERWK